MTRSIVFQISITVFKVLWRLLITAAAVCALGILGLAMVLNMVFNGPSPSARDQLTMTLLESEQTSKIPGYFLRADTIAGIRGEIFSPTGYTDPDRILVRGAGNVETLTRSTDHYSAQILLFHDSTSLHLTSGTEDANRFNITCGTVYGSTHFVGITQSGILQLTSDTATLQGTEAVPCGAILIWDGTANEALFNSAPGFAPRAAIGQAADGTVIFITTDGWTRAHPGASCQDILNLLTEHGAVNACLLSADSHSDYEVPAAPSESEG